MTDDTATLTEEIADGGAVESTSTVASVSDSTPTGWLHQNNHGQTNADRYLMPLITPLLAVGGIIFFVVNLSRVFISGTKTITLIAAVIVTLAILFSASALSNAPKMRSQSLAVYGAVGLLAVGLSGMIAVGHAKEKKEAAIVQCTPVTVTLDINGTTSNTWEKPTYTAKAGCIKIAMSGAAHTFEFTSANAPKMPLLIGAGAESGRTFAATFTPGTYDFHCNVTGHESMKAQLIVT